MSNKIKHAGVVEEIADCCVRVRIMQTSACSSCKVAAHCSASEQKEKVVDVYDMRSVRGLKVGDNVVVSTSVSTGMKAVAIGFMVPFVVMVATLMAVLLTTGNEACAALAALFSLVPCYAGIWLFRGRLKGRFSFVIEEKR